MKKSNYKRKFNKKDSKVEKASEKSTDYKEKPNDPSWYIVNGQLAKDVASFSFNTAVGAPFTLKRNGEAASFANTTPGIFAIYTAPAVGHSMGANSPVNLAAKNLYTFVRHANSGHSNYDSPDLMMYILAMDSVYSWYATMCRLYGITRLYSQTNRYYGSNLITAMGFDPVEINAHLADLRYHINQYAVKMSSFVTPVTMSIYRRHVWMYGNLFVDSPDAKAQIYMYNPGTLLKFNEYQGAGRLEALEVTVKAGSAKLGPRSNLSWQDIQNISGSLINPLVYSEDMNIMSGDILKAYGDSNIWKMDMIPEDYTVLPIYSEEILSQIHNTNFVGGRPFTDSYDINALNVYQDVSVTTGGTILFTPLFRGAGLAAYDKILDMYKTDVTPEDSLVASRNMVHGNSFIRGEGSSAVFLFDPLAMGSEICFGFTILKMNATTMVPEMRVWGFDPIGETDTELLSEISNFRQHPILYTYAPSDTNTLTHVFGELNNYTILDYQDIYDLHSSAIMSELALPMMGVTGK